MPNVFLLYGNDEFAITRKLKDFESAIASAQRAEHVLSVALQGAADRPDTAPEALTAALMMATGADHPSANGVAAAILAAIDGKGQGAAP